MKTYIIYVDDQRRGERIELYAELAHDRRARQFAAERLASSPDYGSIEVWDGRMRLCRLSAEAVRQAA